MNDCVVLEIGNESSVYLIMMRNLFAMILLSDMIEKNELLTDETYVRYNDLRFAT